MHQINVLTPPTLHKLFRQHNDQYPGLLCVMDTIWRFVLLSQMKDLKKKNIIFRKWEKDTTFIPKPWVKPDVSHWADTPVHEHIGYHGQYFFRRTYSIGVTLATQTFVNGKNVFVIWTYNRKAYIFDADLVLIKVLNRQNSPFETWMRHLDGDISTRKEQDHDELCGHRSSEILFHDLVVPLYGSDPMLRDRSRMRGISNRHVIWDLICDVSNILSIPDENRKVWHSHKTCGPYSNTV